MTTGPGPSALGRKHPGSYSAPSSSVFLAFRGQGDAQRLRQELLHLGPGVEEPGHDRSLRNFEYLCKLFVAETVQLSEQQDGAMLLGNLLQRGLNLLTQLVLEHRLLGVAPELRRHRPQVGLG